MEEIKKCYEELVKKREKIVDKLNILQKHSLIKEYNELKAENSELIRRIRDLSFVIEYDQYDKCNHLLVNTSKVSNCNFYGCVKCGLKDDVLMTFDNKKSIMFNYLANDVNYFNFKDSRLIHRYCDLELGQAIYNKIIENHPDIDEDTLVRYFENALDHIRNVDINEYREKSRTKRLELSNNFNNWK